MVASSSSCRLKPTAAATAGEEELKLLKQQMSALKLDHLAPPPTGIGEEDDDQVKLLNQKIAQLKLLELQPPDQEVEEENPSLLIEAETSVTKRLLSVKEGLQCLRVKLKELKAVKPQKSRPCLHHMRQYGLKMRAIAAEARAIAAEAKAIAAASINKRESLIQYQHNDGKISPSSKTSKVQWGGGELASA